MILTLPFIHHTIYLKKKFEKAYKYKSNHVALASNANTPSEILTLLSESEDSEVFRVFGLKMKKHL